MTKKVEDKLVKAVRQMAELPDKDKVSIRGKMYAEVHTRVQAFREAFGVDGKIISKVHVADANRVMTETTVHVHVDGSWREIGNDFAEEFRGEGMVNKTSAVENCLTSSIGRALSACGLSGGSYASFEEMDHAINEKAEVPKDAVTKEKPKKKEPKPQTAEEIKESMEEKGLAEKPKDEKLEKKIRETFNLEDPSEKFTVISEKAIADMDVAVNSKEIEKIWKDSIESLKDIKGEVSQTAWQVWLGEMSKMREEMIKKEKK